MVTYIECPALYEPAPGDPPAVFLAGGITGVQDWQREAVRGLAGLEVVVLNPRRRHFPIDDPSQTPVQIRWEHRALHLAAVTVFWFPRSDASVTTQPIAMLELGAALDNPARRIVVGTDPAFPRAADVQWQARLARPGMRVHTSLTDTLAALRYALHG
ncbi:nucleoside 2-deoxyribosyltransferase domain-containing protein [Streptomyces sp. NPDC047002]|uniref:nucleoside 2-deoxyribosyltransferase domain-containing protein n=1 Tax=Streptomyces sp. NPDC047002 TaxID=3155475 RepID=UPI003453459C